MNKISTDINEIEEKEVFLDINDIDYSRKTGFGFILKGNFEFGSRKFLNVVIDVDGSVYGFPSLDKIENEELLEMIRKNIREYVQSEREKCDEILNKI